MATLEACGRIRCPPQYRLPHHKWVQKIKMLGDGFQYYTTEQYSSTFKKTKIKLGKKKLFWNVNI